MSSSEFLIGRPAISCLESTPHIENSVHVDHLQAKQGAGTKEFLRQTSAVTQQARERLKKQSLHAVMTVNHHEGLEAT